VLVTRLFRAAVLVVLCGVLTAKLQADDVPVARLLETLLSPDTSDEPWRRAADSFLELPVDVAIRTLYPEIAKGIPNGMTYATYNCSDPSRIDTSVVGEGFASQIGSVARQSPAGGNTQRSVEHWSPDQVNLVTALMAASWEIITRSDAHFTRTERPQPCYQTFPPFQSNFSPIQERDKWRVPL